MCGLWLWIIMTNINDLSGPANTTYCTAWAGIVPCDIIRSATTHQHLTWASGPSPRCPWSIVIQILALVSCSWASFAVWVVNGGEHEWVTRLSVPLICSYMLFFWRREWRGAGFSLGDSLTPQVQIPTGPLSEQEQSVSICGREPRLISVHIRPFSHHKRLHFD